MTNYLVTDTDLTTVANAIRNKRGSNQQLEWPSGFVSNINNLSLSDFLDEKEGQLILIDNAAALPLKKFEVNLKPIQDLHGYTSPWPSGSGKNLFDKAQLVSTGSVDVTQTDCGFVLTTKVEGTYKSIAGSVNGSFDGVTVYARANIVNSGNNDGCLEIRFRDASGIEVAGTSSRLRLTPGVSSVSRAVPEGTTEIYVVCYSSRIESGSVGDTTTVTGFIVSLEDAAYEPYENVCPISGWTNVKVTRCGKNLLPNIKTQINSNILVLGQTENYSASQRLYLPAGTYYISVEYDAVATLYWRSTQDAEGGRISSGKTNPSGVFVVERPDYYAFWLYSSSGVPSNSVGNFQLELGSTATAYVPYQGDTYDIALPTEAGTVYGGTLDVTNGTLTVTYGIFTANSASAADSSGKIFRVATQPDAKVVSGTVADLICNRFAVYNLGNLRDDIISDGICQQQTQFYIKRAGCTTVEQTTAWLNDNPITVVYPLATPVTYQLTPQQITMLQGNNTLFSDNELDIIYYRENF